MRNPAIQNDFSYYRRTISRNRINNMHVSARVSWAYRPLLHGSFWMFALNSGQGTALTLASRAQCLGILGFDYFFNNSVFSFFHQLDIENEVNNEMANRMSLFYAEATPMLKTLSNATMHFVSEVSQGKQHDTFLLISHFPFFS